MLTAQEINSVISKGLCCLPKKSAKYIRALWRNEQPCDFLSLAMALDALTGYIPEGSPLFSYTQYTQSQVDNPVYTENQKVDYVVKTKVIAYENRGNINNDITRFFADGTLYVYINNVLIGSQSITVATTEDYTDAIVSIIQGAGHDYEASKLSDDNAEITIPTNNNILRSGQNNSGAFKNLYPVNIYFDGTYPPSMCDYEVQIILPVSEWANTVVKGITVNSVYIPFPNPIPYQNNFPYGHPLYDYGIQKQIINIINPGNVVITIVQIPDPPNLEDVIFTLTIKATWTTVDSVRMDNAFYPDVDWPLAPNNCGSGFYTIYFYNGALQPKLLGSGEYNLGDPPQQCTYGIVMTSDNPADAISAVSINGTTYYPASEILLSDTAAIESWLNSIASSESLICDFEVTYNTDNEPNVFTILKTNYSYPVMDAASFVIDGIEQVKAFEKLSCLVLTPQQVTELQTANTQCLSDETVLNLVSIVNNECCGCTDGYTHPSYPVITNIIGGDESNTFISTENDNPIES